MELVNDSTKLIARVIQMLSIADNLYPEIEEVSESIKMLEDALDKLTKCST